MLRRSAADAEARLAAAQARSEQCKHLLAQVEGEVDALEARVVVLEAAVNNIQHHDDATVDLLVQATEKWNSFVASGAARHEPSVLAENAKMMREQRSSVLHMTRFFVDKAVKLGALRRQDLKLREQRR